MKTILRNSHARRSRANSKCWSDDRHESVSNRFGMSASRPIWQVTAGVYSNSLWEVTDVYGYMFWSACWSRAGKQGAFSLFGSINFGNIK